LAITIETTQMREFIYDRLDLSKVMEYARREYRWDEATASDAEARYRGFLLVAWAWDRGPNRARRVSAISTVADQMWHCHMLLPVEYRDDCVAIFGPGRLLDHMPGYEGDQVDPAERDLVDSAYREVGLPAPTDLKNACVWPAPTP
jgi:hypothetical protein